MTSFRHMVSNAGDVFAVLRTQKQVLAMSKFGVVAVCLSIGSHHSPRRALTAGSIRRGAFCSCASWAPGLATPTLFSLQGKQ
jgi:hypothetical protein